MIPCGLRLRSLRNDGQGMDRSVVRSLVLQSTRECPTRPSASLNRSACGLRVTYAATTQDA